MNFLWGCRRWPLPLVFGLLTLAPCAQAATQWAILAASTPEGAPEKIQFEREEEKNGKIIFSEPGGKTREVTPDQILARAKPAPEAGMEATREDAVSAIRDLLEAKAKAPALEKEIQDEVEKWKALLDKLPNPEDPAALAKAEKAFSEALAVAMPNPYEPAKAYLPEELRKQILALEELKKEFASRVVEIDRLAESWRTDESEQAAGKKKFEGRWLAADEWEKEKGARQAAAREAFLKQFQLPEISPVLLGQGVLLAVLAGAILAAFLGVSFLLHGILEFIKHRAWWKGAAWLISGMALIVLLARASALLLSRPEPLELSQAGRAGNLEEMVWKYAGENQPLPLEVRIEDSDLNAWWLGRLRFAPLAVTEILVIKTEAWSVKFQEGALTLDRTGVLLGKNLTLRHELTFNRSEKGEDVYRVEASLGKLPLPPSLALHSWGNWMEDIARISKPLHGPKPPSLQRIEKGNAIFSNN